MANISGKKVLMVVAFEGFRDEECLDSKRELEKAGAKVVIASSKLGAAKGKLGGSVNVDILYTANASEYDAVAFIGGPGAAVYLNDTSAHKLAKDAYNSGKVLGAICMASSILANAGLLEGKKATAFASEEENLKKKGAYWQDEDVVADGRIVTANGPAAAAKFGRKLAEAIEAGQT